MNKQLGRSLRIIYDKYKEFMARVTNAMPINEEDEAIVDALIKKRTSSLATRPLRRREGD